MAPSANQPRLRLESWDAYLKAAHPTPPSAETIVAIAERLLRAFNKGRRGR